MCVSRVFKQPVQPINCDIKISACSTERILALMRAKIQSGLNNSVLGGPIIMYLKFPWEPGDHVLSVRMFHINLEGYKHCTQLGPPTCTSQLRGKSRG